MGGWNYFLVTSLPALPDPGGEPPMSVGKLLEYVGDSPDARALVEAVALGDDLLQRQAYLAGEIEDAEPAVLTEAQATDEEPLPERLVGDGDRREAAGQLPADAVWEAYYRHLADLAERLDSDFLRAWTGYEVALRNALVEARAKRLEIDATDYFVATDLTAADENFQPLLNEWSSARNPLEALRALDRGRWNWLDRHDAWFSFTDDELAAYAVRLVLLERWSRLQRAPDEPSASSSGTATTEPSNEDAQ